MKSPVTFTLSLLSLGLLVSALSCQAPNSNKTTSQPARLSSQESAKTIKPEVDGFLENGLRILSLDSAQENKIQNFTVYRGDYLRFEVKDADYELIIPELAFSGSTSTMHQENSYVKMKDQGNFAYSLGAISGEIKVIELSGDNYKELDSKQGYEVYKNIKPIILDVRSPAEYKQGHLPGALLIPVQELSSRINELESYKNEEILIYCASGNRSTVASKILRDEGFKRLNNLRQGFGDWKNRGYPVE